MKKNHQGKMKIIKKGYYNTMIFGTSRTKASIHPIHLFSSLGLKTFTEARGLRYPKYFYHFYKKFKSVFGIPKYLIYGLDYFMFGAKTSDIHLFSVVKKKRKFKKLRFGKIVNKTSGALNFISTSFRLKKIIDKTSIDFIYKLSLNWKSHKKNSNQTGISNYAGRKKVIDKNLIRVPKEWEKFSYVNSDNGEGPFLKLLFNELEKDQVNVFLIGIPDFIGTYESHLHKHKFVRDIRGLIKNRKRFWFLNYNHPDHFNLEEGDYFFNGNYGKISSHFSYYGSIPFHKLLSEDIGLIIKGKNPVNNVKIK